MWKYWHMKIQERLQDVLCGLIHANTKKITFLKTRKESTASGSAVRILISLKDAPMKRQVISHQNGQTSLFFLKAATQSNCKAAQKRPTKLDSQWGSSRLPAEFTQGSAVHRTPSNLWICIKRNAIGKVSKRRKLKFSSKHAVTGDAAFCRWLQHFLWLLTQWVGFWKPVWKYQKLLKV